MAPGIFPTMPPSEIIHYLSSWGIAISHEQLLRPTPDFVESVYYACLEHVTYTTVDSVRDSAQVHNALAALDDDHDFYSAALTHNILQHHLTRFATAARINDFNSRDILQPTSERTRYVLSAFINIMRFSQQRATFVQSVRDKSKSILEERDQVDHELAEVTQHIEAVKSKQAANEPKCEEYRKENAALTAKMIATKEIQEKTAGECEVLKQDKSDLLRRKEALNSEITAVSDTTNRTRSRIVQSPERIKRTISVMGETVTDDKKTVTKLDAKARDLQAKIAAFINIEKDVRGCVEQLQAIEKEVRSLERSQKELASLRDHLDDKKVERSELHLKQERVQRQLANANEKLERAQKHAEDRRIASQKTIERLQREYDEMAIERKENDKEIEELRADADEIEAKRIEHLKTSEDELNELLAEYFRLRHETDVYMETIGNKLGIEVQ